MAGTKFDQAKTQWGLLPWDALERVAQVMTYGASKYGNDNWRGGFKWRRVFSAAMRHLVAWMKGIDNDEETGISHLAHAACNILFLITFSLEGSGEDDRPGRASGAHAGTERSQPLQANQPGSDGALSRTEEALRWAPSSINQTQCSGSWGVDCACHQNAKKKPGQGPGSPL